MGDHGEALVLKEHTEEAIKRISDAIRKETVFGYIGGSASGNKKDMHQFNKVYADVYRYFGVEQSDIDNQTRRYKALISALLG